MPSVVKISTGKVHHLVLTAEGDMLNEILGKVKDQGYSINQLVMDHNTSANAIVCSHFPDVHISVCVCVCVCVHVCAV